MPLKERIICVSRLLREEKDLEKEDGLKMQAVLYALANKFLGDNDLRDVKEVLSMTRLGEMLRNDGIELGIQAMVTSFQELKIPYNDAMEKVREKFSLSLEQAGEYMKKYWK